MSIAQKSILLAIAILLIIIFSHVIRNMLTREERTKIVKKRRSSRDMKGSKIGGSLAESFERKADINKKFKKETLYLQAGLDFTYGEFKFISVVSAIAFPIALFIIIRNIYLSIIFILLGYLIPEQVVKTIANNRVKKMEEQCGSFLRIVLERYKTSKDMAASIQNSLHDFIGCDPFYDNLKQCVLDIQLGLPCEEALENLARRCGNKFLARFSDYYKVTDNLATHESKLELLTQALLQYDEDRELKQLLKKEISGPVSESYVMVVATPAFMAWQAVSNPDYMDFMLHEQMGQIGLAVIFVVVVLCIVFINAKIAAPIE